MKRRSFLALLGLAPVAAQAAVETGMQDKPVTEAVSEGEVAAPQSSDALCFSRISSADGSFVIDLNAGSISLRA